MSEKKALEMALYAAFLRAAVAMGPDLRNLSWFARSRKRITREKSDKASMAA